MKKSSKKSIVSESVTHAAFIESKQEDIKLSLLERSLSASADKATLIEKNIKARLRTMEAFKSASESSLDLIVKHSDSQTLEYLLNSSNYKTSCRILDYANKLTESKKYPTVIDAVEKALTQNGQNFISINMLCGHASQCEARVKNVIKALFFFDVIELKDFGSNGKWINSLTKDTTLRLVNK